MNRFLLFTIVVLLPQVVNAEFVLIEEGITHIGTLGKSGSNHYLTACDNSMISIHNKDSLSFNVDAVCDHSQGNLSTDPILTFPTVGANSSLMVPALVAHNANMNSSFVPGSLEPPPKCENDNGVIGILRGTLALSSKPEPECIKDYEAIMK